MAEPVTAPDRLGVCPPPASALRRRRQVRLAPVVAIAVAALPTVLWTIWMWGHGEDDGPTWTPRSNVAASSAPPPSVFTATPVTAAPVTTARAAESAAAESAATT